MPGDASRELTSGHTLQGNRRTEVLQSEKDVRHGCLAVLSPRLVFKSSLSA